MSTTNLDTYIDCLGIDLEDLYEMSEADREAFYKEALADLSTTEATDLAADFEEALDDLRKETLDEYQEDLEDIIDDGDSTTEEIARAERALEEVEALIEFANGEETNFGAAQTELSEENVDATDGEPYTFSATDPENGQEYVIDATSSDVGSDTVLEDPHAEDEAGGENWVDTDGDGYTDTLAAEADGDNIADYDTNNDNVIDETDMLDVNSSTTNQAITIELEQDDTIELASYDADDGTTRWKITKEDGTTYYLTIKGAPDIRFSGDYNFDSAGIESSWGPELLNRVYESKTIESSFGDILEVADPDAPTTDYYTKIDMEDYYDEITLAYSYEITPTEADYEDGRVYEVTASDSGENYLDLTFSEDTDLEFSYETTDDGTKVLVITATNSEGDSVTIKCYDFDPYNDIIHISGGSITEEDITDLSETYNSEIIGVSGGGPTTWTQTNTPWGYMIYQDEDTTPLCDETTSTWTEE